MVGHLKGGRCAVGERGTAKERRRQGGGTGVADLKVPGYSWAMGSTFVSLDLGSEHAHGFWMRDDMLELWLRQSGRATRPARA